MNKVLKFGLGLGLVLLGCGQLVAQKYDNTWLWGIYPQNQNDTMYPYHGNGYGTFDNDTFITGAKNRNMTFSETNCSISDPVTGKLLFYTNGLCVRDSNSQIIQNGDSLGYGPVWHAENGGYGSRGFWSMLAIPFPYHDSLFKLIYRRYDGVGGQGSMCYADLLHTQNEIKLLSKDVKFATATPQDGGIVACKHANGRDWWVIFLEANTNCFHKYLLSTDTFVCHSVQCYGRPADINDACKSVFSPDGSKLLRTAAYGACDVFDFDRCSGLLSNFISLDTFHVIDTSSGNLVDVISSGEISSNNRFVYLNGSYFILQYDLWAADVNSSRDTVGATDFFVDTVPQHTTSGYLFYLSQNAPDGKICYGPGSGKRFFSTIENPNGKGDSCNFKLRSVQLTKWIALTIPYFPNYRLGRLIGSVCDTVYSDIKPIYTQAPWLKVFPNPANDEVQFDYNWIEWERSAECRLLIADLSGRVVMEVGIPKYSTRQSFSIKQLTAGTYLVSLRGGSPLEFRGLGSRVLATCKLVKQ